jgi:hypothetical protein
MQESGYKYQPITLAVMGVFIVLGVIPIMWPNMIGDPWPRISFVALFFFAPMLLFLGLRMLLKRCSNRSDSK